MIFAIALLIVLQAIDLWQTSRFRRGVEQEANPFARWVWRRFGFWGLIAGKLAITSAVVAYALIAPSTAAWIVVGLGIAAVGFVAAKNADVI